jgi:hypothetical protein
MLAGNFILVLLICPYELQQATNRSNTCARPIRYPQPAPLAAPVYPGDELPSSLEPEAG